MSKAWPRVGFPFLSLAVWDKVVAVALTVAGLVTTYGGGGHALALIGSVVSTSSVAFRRRRPVLAVSAAVGGAVVLEQVAGNVDLTVEAVAIALCFYLLGSRSAQLCRWRSSVSLLGCWLAGAVVVGRGTGSGSPAAVTVTWATTGVLPLAFGAAVNRHRQRAAELGQLTAELAAEEELRATLAAEEERCRIARDLHDVVAHCVSVMVIQAGAAARILSRDLQGALAALDVVKDSGREALGDLRRVVGVIRHEPLAAAEPRLSELPGLIERAGQAGVAARLSAPGGLQLPLAIEATVYRIVQEALTNTIKHAVPASATVAVRVVDSTVEVAIADDGVGSRPATARDLGSGRGLAGMRERLVAQGGTLAAGKRPEGGFEVRASLPLPGSRAATGPSRILSSAALALARRPLGVWSDVAIAGVALAAMEAEVFLGKHRAGSLTLNAAVVALMAVAALGRRRQPVIFLLVVGSLSAVLAGGLTSLDYATFTGAYVLILPLWTVATCSRRRTAIFALTLFLVGATATMALVDRHQIGGLVGAAVAGCLVWAAGRTLRAHRRTTVELETGARRLRLRRDERMRVAVATESARVARELQTGVAHALAVIVVETEAAQRLLASGDPKGVDAIAEIEAAARGALAEMRTTLGVLRRGAGDDVHARRVPGPAQILSEDRSPQRPLDPVAVR